MKTLDLTEEKYGRLRPIKKLPNRSNRTMWLCECDCGSQKAIATEALRSGNTQSCGCLQYDNRFKNKRVLPFGEAAFNTVYAKYKQNALGRELEFELSKEEFRELVGEPCHYCGLPPSNVEACGGSTNGHFRYSGIDRVDPEKGYVKDNCVPCCRTCNFAKHSMKYDEFISWLHRISDHLGICLLGVYDVEFN